MTITKIKIVHISETGGLIDARISRANAELMILDISRLVGLQGGPKKTWHYTKPKTIYTMDGES
jgi:hypothetical protein